MEITEAIRAYVVERLQDGAAKFTTHFDADGTELSVECGRTSNHHKNGDVYRCEAQLSAPGNLLFRAEATKDDLYAAIDAVKNELQRQVKDQEKKNRSKSRRGGAFMKKLRSYIPFMKEDEPDQDPGM